MDEIAKVEDIEFKKKRETWTVEVQQLKKKYSQRRWEWSSGRGEEVRRLCGVCSKQDMEKQGLIRNIKFCHEKKQKQQVCVWFTNVKAIAFGWRGR